MTLTFTAEGGQSWHVFELSPAAGVRVFRVSTPDRAEEYLVLLGPGPGTECGCRRRYGCVHADLARRYIAAEDDPGEIPQYGTGYWPHTR